MKICILIAYFQYIVLNEITIKIDVTSYYTTKLQ